MMKIFGRAGRGDRLGAKVTPGRWLNCFGGPDEGTQTINALITEQSTVRVPSGLSTCAFLEVEPDHSDVRK